MRRTLTTIAILAGLTWGGMTGWAANVRETGQGERIRTAAFVVMIAAGCLYPVSHSGEENADEETL